MWNPFKKKEKKIKFYSLLPAVNTLYPITPANKFKREWVAQEKEFFTEYEKKCPLHKKFEGLTSVGRCPAIKTTMNTGYILYAPADFIINTTGDGKEINATHKHVLSHAPYVDTHAEWQSEWVLPSASPCVNRVVKLNLPWRLLTNDNDIIFLITSVQYHKEDRFTQMTGIMDPLITSEINCQLAWHVMNDTVTVHAGTPIAQIIPMSRSALNYHVEVCDATQELVGMEQEMIYSGQHQFGTDYKSKVNNMAKILKKYGFD